MTLQPHEWGLIGIAISAVVIPLVRWLWVHYMGLWADRKKRRTDEMLADYVTTTKLDARHDEAIAHQDRLHGQNTALLLQIKDDGTKREGLMLGTIKQVADEARAAATRQDTAMSVLHRRVDELMALSGERRRQR